MLKKLLATYIFICFIIAIPDRNINAEICAMDNVPAATLLFPYFEQEFAKNCSRAKTDTQFKITNASGSTRIAHVTLWTNWSVPAINFNISLPASGISTIDLNDILCKGNIPEQGTLQTAEKLHYQALFSGRQSQLTSTCASEPVRKNTMTGYATVDVVQASTNLSPADSSYYSNLSDANVLIGDYYVNDKTVAGVKKFCGSDTKCAKAFRKAMLNTRGIHGAPAVHIEAAPFGTFFPGDHTFYGRYIGELASDRREPLPLSYHVRYSQTVGKGKLDLIVWREGGNAASPITCGTSPAWKPILTSEIIAFNENQQFLNITNQVATPNKQSFSLETQLVKNISAGLPYTSGWLQIDFTDDITGNPSLYNETMGWVVQRRNGIIDSAGVTPLSYPASCN